MTKIRIPLSLLALMLAMLACSIFVGGPDYPEESIPVSTEAVESMKSQMEAAVIAGAESGVITLQITEEQITSNVALKLASQSNPTFQDPQIYLRDGQMKIYGHIIRGYLEANILVVLTLGVDELNQPQIEIVSADFGPFPAPEGLKQTFTALITEAYTGSLGPIATGFRLESINITDGLMTVTGRLK